MFQSENTPWFSCLIHPSQLSPHDNITSKWLYKNDFSKHRHPNISVNARLTGSNFYYNRGRVFSVIRNALRHILQSGFLINTRKTRKASMEREQLNYFLQQVEVEELLSLSDAVAKQAQVELIRRATSQTLLVPVHDPINQGNFFSGEILVTSALVQVNAVNGWSMVMDENPETAVAVAILDGAFAADIFKEDIIKLALRGRKKSEKEHAELNARVHATRVAFDLL